jgi:hypothetical protein
MPEHVGLEVPAVDAAAQVVGDPPDGLVQLGALWTNESTSSRRRQELNALVAGSRSGNGKNSSTTGPRARIIHPWSRYCSTKPSRA